MGRAIGSLAWCATLLAAVPLPAGTIVLIGDRDNTLYESATGATSNGSGMHFFTGRTLLGDLRRGLLRFDLSAIPPGSTVEEVILTLQMSRTLAGPSDVALHRATADWGEGASDAPGQEGAGTAAEPGDATWLHTSFDTDFWSSPGGDFAPVESAATTVADEGSYSWGSTSGMEADVSAWVDDPSINHGWVLVGDEDLPEGVDASSKRFDSREIAGSGASPPQLTVSYTAPVPVELVSFTVDPR